MTLKRGKKRHCAEERLETYQKEYTRGCSHFHTNSHSLHSFRAQAPDKMVFQLLQVKSFKHLFYSCSFPFRRSIKSEHGREFYTFSDSGPFLMDVHLFAIADHSGEELVARVTIHTNLARNIAGALTST